MPEPAPVRSAPTVPPNLLRRVFVVNSVQRRWPFALRAAFCVAVPVLIGWATGNLALGLLATIGGFTSLYGSGRPYLNRAGYLAVVAVCFGVAVAVGDWASVTAWTGVLAVSVIAMAAVLLCSALSVGPPGAYMFVLACAVGVGVAPDHVGTVQIGLLVTAGGAFSWLVQMSGILVRPRGPEKAAVAAAGEAVARYVEAVGTDAEADTRHRAAHALHDAWVALVTFQPARIRLGGTVSRLRSANRQLHVLFAEVMRAADRDEPLPDDAARRARELPAAATDFDGDRIDDLPIGRAGVPALVRQALRPGSKSLFLMARAGIAVIVAGSIAGAPNMLHAYWAMAAAVLILHQGFEWLRTLQRGVERVVGTWLGLILAAAVLSWYPQGLALVLVIAVLQFLVEMSVVRNYGLAVVFITPLALTISAGGRAVPDLGQLLLARGADTMIGCLVALAVYRLTERRRPDAVVAKAIANTLDAVAATVPHLAAGVVTGPAARAARRDLQIRAIALVPAYHAGVGGSPRQRVAAERLWPAVASTERLAYRTLATCWAIENIGADNAPDVGRSLLGPDELRRLTAALSDLAAAVRTGRPPEPGAALSGFGGAEVAALRESLVGAEQPGTSGNG